MKNVGSFLFLLCIVIAVVHLYESISRGAFDAGYFSAALGWGSSLMLNNRLGD
jgi:hypothetical protein